MKSKVIEEICMIIEKNTNMEEFIKEKEMIVYTDEYGQIQVSYNEDLLKRHTYSLVYKYYNNKIFIPTTRKDFLNLRELRKLLNEVVKKIA